jgi:hypothetical protein
MQLDDASRYPWPVRLALRTGIPKTRRHAEMLVVVFVLLSFVFTFWTFFPRDQKTLDPREDPNYDPTLTH